MKEIIWIISFCSMMATTTFAQETVFYSQKSKTFGVELPREIRLFFGGTSHFFASAPKKVSLVNWGQTIVITICLVKIKGTLFGKFCKLLSFNFTIRNPKANNSYVLVVFGNVLWKLSVSISQNAVDAWLQACKTQRKACK